jgi:release factor glutamine methyltransferase
MLTVLEIIRKTTEFLTAKGIESARLNAELLIGHALERKRMQLYLEFERPLAEVELERIRPLVRRRAGHEPLQYILGETEFQGLRLMVDRRALIPRPETELLVELAAQRWAGAPPARILDLGTGSGAIAVALATRFPDAAVLAVDRSAEALDLARENAEATGLASRIEFRLGNWFDAVPAGTFDLIVSNPPYLTEEETAATAPEVRNFEPVTALTAPEDGLADLRRIVVGAAGRLTGEGWLALETGIAHHPRLSELAAAAGFTRVECAQDLAGRDRFVFARR